MKPRASQIELAEQALSLLREHAIAYLACEERTGKTLAAILVAEYASVTNVLVLTKKKALDGWFNTLKEFEHKKVFYVTNYHQAAKVNFTPDLVILDEAHSYIAAYPKRSVMWNTVKAITKGKPILYLSATPNPQGYQQLYHQFALSDWSPWAQYKRFYDWFKVYGNAYSLKINGEDIPQYDNIKPEAYQEVKHLFITKTRAELGFVHEPEDVLHYVELCPEVKDIYNKLRNPKLRIAELEGHGLLVADTSSKLRAYLHMLEGGVIKLDEKYIVLPFNEKVDYIKKTFGDTADMVIMYQYIAEGIKLRQQFKNALILQGTSYAEGVDLHKYKHLIIYSQDFSTGRHTQRRARQANMNRSEPIQVHFILVKGAISARVYQTVSVNKKNFVDTVFGAI